MEGQICQRERKCEGMAKVNKDYYENLHSSQRRKKQGLQIIDLLMEYLPYTCKKKKKRVAGMLLKFWIYLSKSFS